MKKRNLKSLKLKINKIARLESSARIIGGVDSAKWPCAEMDTFDIHCPSEVISGCAACSF